MPFYKEPLNPEPSRVSWVIIRNIGELQILTRASYLLLIAIPLFASLWGPIKSSLTEYNEALINRSESIQESLHQIIIDAKIAVERIETEIGRTNSSKFIDALEGTKARIMDELNRAVEKLTIPNIIFPWEVGALYIAVFSVVIGHALYQARCPPIIKSYRSIDDYLSYQKDQFSNFPTAGMVQRAEKDIDKYIANTNLEKWSVTEEGDYNKILSLDQKMEVLQRWMALRFVYYSKSSHIEMYCCVVLYAIAIILILCVMISQAFYVIGIIIKDWNWEQGVSLVYVFFLIVAFALGCFVGNGYCNSEASKQQELG